MQLELIAKLLDTEQQYHLKLNRKGLFDAFEQCFVTYIPQVAAMDGVI
jgi:DNA sulfur modification protein DndC